jgi:hypothetical protein|uniref:Fibronectin type-III domain-containing protein n=1 Tax=candidate division WOR-3 bacterium TaxID=2052148 RepID=A0A7V3RGZ3_UNCW3
MKKVLILSIFALLVIFVGCEKQVTLETPEVTYTVKPDDKGGTLVLNWDEITDADGYYIYADGKKIDSVTTTSYNATTPAALYEVSAYAGDQESGKDEIDCGAIETATLTVYGSSDPDTTHPSGFGFNAQGNAVAYAISNQNNWPLIDYWVYSSGPTTIKFVSPSDRNPPLNNEVNVTKNSGQTNYNDVKIADAPGGYSTQTDVVSGAVYYFWIDPNNDGWDASTDHFGKIQVVGINGVQLTLKIAYQKIAGLRWCVVK